MELLAPIITALIAGICSVIGAFFASKAQGEKQMQKIIGEVNKNQAVTDERIKELTEKVDKHNSVIERTYALEKDISLK